MFAKRAHSAHDFELNLTPIIDCFVTLICFLLLSATYVNLVSMDAKVPIAVPTSTANTDTTPKFKLELDVRTNGIELITTGSGAQSGKKFFPAIKGVASPYDLASLHAELVKIKHAHPKEFSIHFNSQVEMKYEELIRFMDITRNLDAKDGVFTITDERNGQTVKVDLLFPDFIMANLGAKK